MQIQTAMFMSLGRGTVYDVFTKQRLNTTSSTEAKLVGFSDVIQKLLWTRLFMEAQGYNVNNVYVYKYNQIATLLENNCMKSVGKNSRHIKTYFFL